MQKNWAKYLYIPMEIKKIEEHRCSSVKITVEDDGAVIAWAFLYIIPNDRHTEASGLMENVYVEKPYRGRGIGKVLVEQVIEEARQRGCYKLLGQSRYGKEDVHALYEKFGFHDHGKNFRMDLKQSSILQKD